MHSIRLRSALSALLIAVAVAACGGSTATNAPGATTAPAATTAPGATTAPASAAATGGASTAAPSSGLATTGRIEVPDKGFAVTLPDGWNRVDLSSGDLEAMMAAGGELEPALVEQYAAQIQAMISAGLAVFAFGPDPASGTNLTILALPGGGMSLDLLEQINAASLEALAEGGVESERITLPAGEALHFTYKIAGQTGTGPGIDQYMILAGDNQLVVTVTGGSTADAEAIANSIEVLD